MALYRLFENEVIYLNSNIFVKRYETKREITGCLKCAAEVKW
jgi:hypothetical protein